MYHTLKACIFTKVDADFLLKNQVLSSYRVQLDALNSVLTIKSICSNQQWDIKRRMRGKAKEKETILARKSMSEELLTPAQEEKTKRFCD